MPTATLTATADGFYRISAGSAEYTKILADDNVYINSDGTQRAYTFIFEDMPGGALSVQAVRCAIRFKLVGGSNHLGPGPRTRYAGTDVDVAAADDGIADAGERTWTYTLIAPTGGWTPAVVSQCEFGFMDVQDSPTAGVFSIDLFEVYVDYQGSGLRIENAREVASRAMLLGRRPVPTVDFDAGLALADVLPGQIISLSHEEGLSPAGGWGPNAWERRPLMALGSTVDPKMRTQIKALDVMQYQYLRSLWRTLRTREAVGADEQGVIKLDCGAQSEFLRDSAAFGQAAPDGVWKRAEKNVERIGLEGLRMEPERINAQPYSSFRNGYASGGFYVLSIGAGSAVDNDSTVLWFDPAEGIRYSLRITAGTGATTVTGTATTATYYAANTKIVVSVYHLEDTSTQILALRIIRADGKFWRDSDSTWQAGSTDNPIASSLTREVWRSKIIDVGAAATSLQLVYVTNVAAPGKKTWIFHGQHEAGESASSPIETVDATPVTRAGETLRLYTSNPPHVWPLERGVAWCDFIADWNSADLTSGNRELLSVAHGGSDSSALRYSHAAGVVRFFLVVGGVTYSASLTMAVVRGTKYRAIARWCSALGEWGLAPYTISVWAGPVTGSVAALTKGTDAVASGASVPLATRSLYIGSAAAAVRPFWGLISNVGVTPLCLPDWMIEDL